MVFLEKAKMRSQKSRPGRIMPIRLYYRARTCGRKALIILLLMVSPCVLASDQALFVDDGLRALLKQTISRADSFGDRFDAEVWLVDMSGRLGSFVKDEGQRLHTLRLIHQEATNAGLKPELVLSIIEIESHFDPYALSVAGAQGLMQVMPFWKQEIGRSEDNLIDILTNLRYGCAIISYYLNMEEGNLTRALARYNGSLGKTEYPEKVLLAWERRWFTNNQ